jgi:hypothetical protein
VTTFKPNLVLFPAPILLGEKLQRFRNYFTGWCRSESNDFQKGRQEAPYAAPTLLQLLIVHILRRSLQRVDLVQRGFEIFPLQSFEDSRAAHAASERSALLEPAPAIANAIYNACGKRVGKLPITLDKLLS